MDKKIVKFNGGLGNQMFQYAFGLALSSKFNIPIAYDFSYFEDVKSNINVATRVFELGVFNLECKQATADELAKIVKPECKSKLKRFLVKKFPEKFGINYINEKNSFVFDKKLLDNRYFAYEGYFQNENYFKHLRTELIKSFSLKEELDEKNQQILSQIQNENSVSLHVRRGDYVSLDYVNKIHGVCSLDYYRAAIGYIAKAVSKPHFYLFSDDIDWVIENLKIDYPYTIVDFNQGRGWFDLNLMKNCKHNIIANSSFSWWGAWLNEYCDKIVIAPKKWMNKKQKEDVIPSSWIKL